METKSVLLKVEDLTRLMPKGHKLFVVGFKNDKPVQFGLMNAKQAFVKFGTYKIISIISLDSDVLGVGIKNAR